MTVKRLKRRGREVVLLPEYAAFQPIEVDLATTPFSIEGIGVGLGGEHRHVRRDARQHLVARHQQLQLVAMQARMLGRMAVADDHTPVVRADLEALAVAHAPEAVGQRVHHAAEAAEAHAVVLDRLVDPPEPHQRRAQIVVRIGIARIDPQRFANLPDRVVVASELLQHASHVVVRFRGISLARLQL